MNIRHEKFVDYYMELGNAHEAALRAGYSKESADSYAGKLLNNPEVVELIKQRLREHQSESVATVGEILRFLTSVMRGDCESEMLLIEKNAYGDPQARIITKKPDTKERLSAARMLLKYFKFSDLDLHSNAVSVPTESLRPDIVPKIETPAEPDPEPVVGIGQTEAAAEYEKRVEIPVERGFFSELIDLVKSGVSAEYILNNILAPRIESAYPDG